MSEELEGRTALGTGASRGIGRAIARAMAGAGADVAVSYRSNDSEAEKVCADVRGYGRRCVVVRGDVARQSDVERLPESVHGTLCQITISGIMPAFGLRGRTIENITEQDWDQMLATNLKGVFLLTQAVLPDMRAARWGRIINLSSAGAALKWAVWSGSITPPQRRGVLGLTHYYAAQLAREGITANSIAPGPIATDMASALPQLTAESVPVGRFGTVEEVAQVALMLATNGFITGQTINVNGGRYLA